MVQTVPAPSDNYTILISWADPTVSCEMDACGFFGWRFMWGFLVNTSTDMGWMSRFCLPKDIQSSFLPPDSGHQTCTFPPGSVRLYSDTNKSTCPTVNPMKWSCIENLDLYPSTRQCQAILRYKHISISNCQYYVIILYYEFSLVPAVSGFTQIPTKPPYPTCSISYEIILNLETQLAPTLVVVSGYTQIKNR